MQAIQAFYDLKQASRLWYKQLLKFLLKKLSLYQINANHSIFFIEVGIKSLIVSTFINNIIIIEDKKSEVIEQVKKKFVAAFDIVNIGPISLLKIERYCIKKILKLFQLAYINKIMVKYYLNQAKPYNGLIKERILLPNKRSKASQVEQE